MKEGMLAPDFKTHLERVIWCLRYDIALISHLDRAWIADMLEHNIEHPIQIKGAHLVFWHDRQEELQKHLEATK